MAQFYPDQLIILPMTTIRRERFLPPDVRGEVLVREDERVSAVDVVARAVRSTRYEVIDLGAILRTTDPDVLAQRIIVENNKFVRKDDPIASDGRKVLARTPITGLVVDLLEGGKLVLQTDLEDLEVKAGFRATVASVREDRGVLLEAIGGLVQGVWGNGKAAMGQLRLAPEGNLGNIPIDEFSQEWRGTVVYCHKALDKTALRRAHAQEIGGIVAPGMPASLRRIALAMKMPIILTDGFSAESMNRFARDVFEQYIDRQVSINAVVPERQQSERPEVIMPTSSDDRRVPTPMRNEHLHKGSEVRITRQPFLGVIGTVKYLPAAPRRLENGLRLPVADVSLPSGRTVTVPLMNLELFGRG